MKDIQAVQQSVATPFVVCRTVRLACRVFSALPVETTNFTPLRFVSVIAVNVTFSPGDAILGEAYVARIGSAAVTVTVHIAFAEPQEAVICALPGDTA